jgi:hypothetical protein
MLGFGLLCSFPLQGLYQVINNLVTLLHMDV